MAVVSDDDIVFEPETGQVRVPGKTGNQLVMRLTQNGVSLWNKSRSEEDTIPWYTFLQMAVRVVCDKSVR